MPKIALTNMQGANVGEIELADGIFAVPMNEPVVHQVIVAPSPAFPTTSPA